MQKSKRLHLVIDDKIPYLEGMLNDCATIQVLPGKQISQSDIKHADALLVRTRTQCNEDLLKDSSVKFIGSATIGYDHIDTEFCKQNNISWTNAPGCNADSVAQYITSALTHLARKYSFDLKDKTLGIIGVGNVGSRVAKLAHQLGMKVLLNDPPRERKEPGSTFIDLDSLLTQADIITMHVPLNKSGNDSTLHLANQSFFNKLNKAIYFINSSRGEVVHEEALLQAMESGKVTGSVIDVWENEPAINPDLLQKVDIATPHIAGYSNEGKANGTAMIVQALSQKFSLGKESWYPANLPQDKDQIIRIKETETKDIIYQAVQASYNIVNEDQNFRNKPSDFENIRGNYGLRREFPYYTVELDGHNAEALKILESLGFQVKKKG